MRLNEKVCKHLELFNIFAIKETCFFFLSELLCTYEFTNDTNINEKDDGIGEKYLW